MAQRTKFSRSTGRSSSWETLLSGAVRVCLIAGLCLAVLSPPHSLAQEDAQTFLNQYREPGTPTPAPDSSLPITVHGQVRNALTGEPLPRTLVRIEGDASTGALTDGEGRFEIPGVPAGPQVFEVRKPGFYDRPPMVGGAELESRTGSTHNVMLTSSMPDLIFTLAPTGSIRGQIVLSTGEPALGIAVELLRRNVADGRAVWQMTSSTKTNSEGKYRFAGLTAGVYVVYTEPLMESEAVTLLVEPGSGGAVARSGYASVFYPDARDLAGAAKIQITGGEPAQANFALTLEAFYSVTAVAGLPASSKADEGNLTATVLDAAGHRLPYIAQIDPATKTVQTTLPDGSYTLLVTSQPKNQDFVLRGKFYSVSSAPDSGALSGSASLTIAGHAVADLRIPLIAPSALQVHLTVLRPETRSSSEIGTASPAASSPAGQSSIEVTASQTSEWISDGLTTSFAQQMQPGTNPATHLPPGSYWLRSFSASSGLCEQSFTAAGANLAREPLTVSLIGAVPLLELTLRGDCSKLTLSLPQSLMGIPAGEEPSYTVYVVPTFDSTSVVEPMTLRPSSGGMAVLEGLTPGTYRVFTFNAPVLLEYRNAAVLAALPNPGQTITLSPGAVSQLMLEVPAQ